MKEYEEEAGRGRVIDGLIASQPGETDRGGLRDRSGSCTGSEEQFMSKAISKTSEC